MSQPSNFNIPSTNRMKSAKKNFGGATKDFAAKSIGEDSLIHEEETGSEGAAVKVPPRQPNKINELIQ